MTAEIFGVVSAGVGIAAACGQLIDGTMKLHSFWSQIRNIPDDVQTTVNDLSATIEVLEFVQVEMGHEPLPLQPSSLSSCMKVLWILQQSSQQVEEILGEMQIKLGKKKFWGRIKAVGMTKKLENAAKRVENAQRMILILLAAENRMTFRYSFNTYRGDLTAISTRNFSTSCADQSASEMSRDTHANNDIESSNTTDENPNTVGPASRQPIYTTCKAKGRRITSMKLRLSNLFLNSVWEFSVYKANQGWDFSLRSYNLRPWDAQIFQAISNGDLSQTCELLHSGRASVRDQDPSGNGVLHYAARSCSAYGSTIIEYLVKSGADIYGVDFDGFPPLFSFSNHEHDYEHVETSLAAGYKVFTSHRDWIPPHPSTRVQCKNFKAANDLTDVFPMFRSPPKEIIRSVLHEMWPPWKDMLPADRIGTLFPDIVGQTLIGAINPLCMRACLSHEYIQETFPNWDTKEKVVLMTYAFDALAKQLACGVEKGIEEARSFLRDMHTTNCLINELPEVDSLQVFVHRYAGAAQTRLEGFNPPFWRVERYVNAARKGLNLYISELMILGIDMATVIDVEKKVLARLEEKRTLRGISLPGIQFKVIAIDYGLKADDWCLWLSNPLDEWAGEFWDMIDHPERAIPGAWHQDSLQTPQPVMIPWLTKPSISSCSFPT